MRAIDRAPIQHAILTRPDERLAPKARKAANEQEAAQQFEELLVRQFVNELTKGLFQSSLAGEDAPGWVQGQHQTQQDVLTDALTEQIVQSNGLGLSDMLMRKWQRPTIAPEDLAQDSPETLPPEGPNG